MNVKQNAIDNVFLIDNSTITVQPVCKYLGVFVPCPRSKLIEYYRTNFNAIIQYCELVYGCTSYSMLEPIFMHQKILKLIYFRKYSDSSSNLLMKHKILKA